MNERITLVSLFNNKDLAKINNIIKKIKFPLCKVPYKKGIENRLECDTLPYHFTISAWNVKKQDFIINALSKIKFNSFKITIDSIKIMNGKENSYVLYFNIIENRNLKSLQEQIYQIEPSEKYNPITFKFHITITISKDYEKIIKIKNELEKDFTPFELEVNKFGLFEIYPASLIYELASIK